MTFLPLALVGLLAQAAPLQARLDAAPPGGVVYVTAGVYEGDLVIDRPVRLIGVGRPRLVGSGKGSVILVRAADVTIEGFDIDGRGGGRLEDDSAGIHVAARRATIRDCRIVRSLFGVYLREADGATIERSTILGAAGKDPGDQGSGIHIFNTSGFSLIGNTVRDSRDGFYLQNASHGRVVGNAVSDVRYGLHYMYSDDNVFEDNVFERSAAGAALMYSARIEFRRNRFLHNRGFTSVGLLMQACDDVLAEDNLVLDNARGIFLEGTTRNVFRRNIVAQSDVAIVLYDSTRQNRFEGNAFVANLSPLLLVGRRTDTVFDGNYWAGHDEPDLDGDGVRDRPFRLSSVFDHLRGNLTAADLFAQGLGASVLASAERMFPVLEPISVADARPLVEMPRFPGVPLPSPSPRRATYGMTLSAALLLAGLATVWSAHRRRAAAW